jgi:hypothetical protein
VTSRPVFDAILEKAHTLCGADQGSLFLYDGEVFRAVATRAMPEAFAALLCQCVGASATTLPLLAGEPLVHVHDLAAANDSVSKAAAEIAGTRRLLAVAPSTSAVAVCCSSASRVSVIRRAFSIAMTAWAQSSGVVLCRFRKTAARLRRADTTIPFNVSPWRSYGPSTATAFIPLSGVGTAIWGGTQYHSLA